MLPSGRLNQRIELQTRSGDRDAFNAQLVDWVTTWSGWAAVEPSSGRKVEGADQPRAEIVYDVLIRQPGPVPDDTWRVTWGTTVLAIEAVLPDKRRDRLTLLCSQGVDKSDP